MKTKPRLLAKITVTLLLVACAHTTRDTIPVNRYGLHVIETAAQYRSRVAEHPDERLVDLSTIPDLRLDLRYATENNFMHRRLYPLAKAFLRTPAAQALTEANEELRTRGLALKVFDAYRPYSVTEAMWEPYKNPDYVADPAKGSRHNRGAAVDLTIVNDATGEELAMPTPFDDFTLRAHHEFAELPPEVIANRALLRSVMESHGFVALPSEWWHYDFRGWEEFPLMNVPLADLP